VVCALVTRQRASVKPGPALLLFTIYVDLTDNLNDARLTAANGYVGVVGFTRGKACSPDAPIPYEHDGTDASALIDWITSQPWRSNERVARESIYGAVGGTWKHATKTESDSLRVRPLIHSGRSHNRKHRAEDDP
jgi:hypothetical protein